MTHVEGSRTREAARRSISPLRWLSSARFSSLRPPEGRFIDRGNADVRSIEQDFRRLGIGGLNARLQARNSGWAPPNVRGDRAIHQDLIELRNALAHGNQGQLDRLRTRGVADTVTWARRTLPGLNRTARALDRTVWDHLRETFRSDPW